MKIRHGLAAGVVFGAGIAFGALGMLDLTLNDKPTIIVQEKWKTVTTTPTTSPDLSHTSLNPDELKTILSLEAQSNSLYINPSALPSQQVLPPVPCVPPTTPVTVAPRPDVTSTTQTTMTPLPSTSPPSSGTSTESN